MTARRRAGAALVAVALGVGAAAWLHLARPAPPAPLAVGAPALAAWAEGEPPFAQPVGACALPPTSSVLVCNYSDLAAVDLDTLAAFRLTPPPGVTTWNPTALAFDAVSGLVFVANYKGQDVLALRVDLASRSTLLERRLSHPALRSPEGVAVSADGALVAVADFDGRALLLFRADGELLWRRETREAHGVAFLGDRVAVTSLAFRQVLLFDLAGELVRARGELGWGRDQYLWPTSLSARGEELLVSDAHTGRLSVLGPDLAQRRAVGANGRAPGHFNFPYHAGWWTDDTVLVADTFRSRLALVDLTRRTIVRRIALRPGGRPDDLGDGPPLGAGWSGYQGPDAVRLELPACAWLTGDWRPGYARLTRRDGVELRLVPAPGGNHAYFLQAARTATGDVVLGSPQCSVWWVLRGGVAFPVELDQDHWLEGDALVGRERVRLDALVARVTEREARLAAADLAGWAPALASALLLGVRDPDRPSDDLAACFTSDPGQRLWQDLTAAAPLTAAALADALERYRGAARGAEALPLWEVSAVGALARLSAR
ncbi:MAG: hypothetical protein M9894_33865 [Planctomycetes bacterium]|nr:hypothetical protein [Planctomycetota bacterium]